MSGFRFPLGAVLRLRRTLARHEETQLARLLAHRAQLANHLNDIEQRARECAEATQTAALGGITGAELSFGTAALTSYHRQAARIEGELRRLALVVDQQRTRLQAAQREQEKLEKLQESAHASWMQKRNRHEQQAADELFLLRRRRTMPLP